MNKKPSKATSSNSPEKARTTGKLKKPQKTKPVATEHANMDNLLFIDSMIDESPLATWVSDPSGTVQRTNRALLDSLGLSKDQIVGKYNILEDKNIEIQGVMPLVKAVYGDLQPARFSIWWDADQSGSIEYSGARSQWIDVVMFPILDVNQKLASVVCQWIDITQRKQVESALRENEQRLESIFRAAPTGIGVVVNRVFEHVNTRMCEMVGYTEAELIGEKSRMLYFSDEDFEYVGREKYEQIKDHGTGTVETRFKHKDGHLIDVLLSSTPINADDLTAGVTFTALDITDRKQAERELIAANEVIVKSENYLDGVINNIGDPVFVKDSEKRFHLVNDAFCELLGLEREEILDKTLAEDFPPDETEHFNRIDNLVLSNGIMNVSEELLTFRDSKTKTLSTSKSRFIDNSGKKFIIGVIHDISQRKQLEDEREKFVMLANSSSEFIGICDLDFTPNYVNPAGIRLVGLTSLEAACQVKVQDYFFPEDQQFITEEFFPRVLHEREGDVEIRLRHFKTGEAIWMSYYLYSILDKEGEITGWATVSRDITQEYLLRKELEKSRDVLRLLSQQLISVREDERASLALELHDGIGQVLTAINFDLDSIQTKLTPEQSQIGVKIEEMIQLLRNSIRDVQRISGELRPRLLDELGLDDAILWYANEFSTRTTIEVKYMNKMAIRKVDAPRSMALFRIMQEALTNVSRHAEASKVMISLGDTSDGIYMKIADDGVGIQLAEKRSLKSIGLVGMEERTIPFGGTFTIEARKSGGTIIIVDLPDTQKPPPA